MTLLINSAADLEAIKGTMPYTEFLTLLEGSLWRIERDDAQQTFVAIEDNSTIERFGLTRDDFPNAQPPALPTWTPLPSTVPQTVTRLQAKAALMQAGHLDDVEAVVADPATDPLFKLAWADALVFERQSPGLISVMTGIGLTGADIDALFEAAALVTV